MAERSAKLGLDQLFLTAFADLDEAFVVTLAGFRNAQYVTAVRDVGQYDAARAADTSLSLIVDVDLGAARAHHDKTRAAGTRAFIDVLGRILEFRHPVADGRRTISG